MNLGTLAVLAVAAVLPGLCHGRAVSDCELLEKLRRAIALPRHLQRYQENVLATVICELNLKSGLISGLVNVYGTRRTTTTARPTTTPEPTTLEPTTTETTTLEPTTTTPEPTTTETTTLEPSTTTTTPEPTTTETTTLEPSTTTTTPETTTAEIIEVRKRRKRASQRNRESNSDRSLMELLKKEQSLFDEKKLEQDNNRMSEEDRDRDEHNKRDIYRKHDKRQPWSLGLYGLFQLSDGHFCDSGYRWSRNVCRTNCTAFANDDIMDDIACFVNTNYWWYLLKNASRSCFNTTPLTQKCP